MTLLITPIALAGTTRIYPTNDAYADSSQLNTVFNNDDLRAGNFPNQGNDEIQRSYLKFNLSSLDGKTITNSVLSIRAISIVNNPTINLYYVPTDSWSQSSITWENQPILSTFTLVDSKLIVQGRNSYNVNSVINETDNILSLALVSTDESTQNKYVQFFSYNHLSEGERPYLEVSYVGGEECPNADFTNVCCSLTPIQMMGLINKFNSFQVTYSPIQMMGFINKFNSFQNLC